MRPDCACFLPVMAVGVCGLFLTSTVRAVDTDTAALPSGGRVPVLVELFTSEGCSSCPPADLLLARLMTKQFLPEVDIIALEQHVDYWDRLGWKDPFSSGQFTARQAAYQRVFGLDSIYTPQMVVDGVRQFVGSDQREARKALAEAARRPKARVSAGISSEGKGTVTASVRVEEVPAEVGSGNLQVLLAVVEDQLVSNVHHGENAGRRLVHQGVVRHLESLGSFKPAKAPVFSRVASLSLNPDWETRNLRLVVFAQNSHSKQVVGVMQEKVVP